MKFSYYQFLAYDSWSFSTNSFENFVLPLQPLPETVALVEEIVVEYITDTVNKAEEIGSKRGKLLIDDILHLIRKDMPKLHRCKDLLGMHEELKQARKAFDIDQEKIATED
ncbi:Transcription initiation factor tfiid subunit [Thalictrum thalictroides]|uniref:Transcription initiation factor TFIID subunit 13 n=1 Tax=Thalictrum thalictroides TaxID=46969 RepID=A0A7J6WC35_THATH|nr:Transcription initiation factor tfiid subunit [Thalictrum thalictroides]